MRIAVLGCGPAGLMVAHAVKTAGHEPVIMTDRKQKSRTGGCMYLHSAVPGVTDRIEPRLLTYTKWGSRDSYAKKVYGVEDAAVSWDQFDGQVYAWPFPVAYDKLWDLYERDIHAVGPITYHEVDAMMAMEFPEIFSTIPLTALARHSDEFVPIYQDVWVTAPIRAEMLRYGEGIREYQIVDMSVIYNGYECDPWYRLSFMFGMWSVEFPKRNGLPEPAEAVSVRKPLTYTGHEPMPHVRKFGRYGQWKKGVLIDHAYKEALAAAESIPR